jgi:hypothetical protein
MLKEALLPEVPSTSNGKDINELHSLGLSFAGFEECRQNVRDRTNDEQFSASYGVSASTLYAVLEDLAVETPRIKTKDFLSWNFTLLSMFRQDAGTWMRTHSAIDGKKQ